MFSTTYITYKYVQRGMVTISYAKLLEANKLNYVHTNISHNFLYLHDTDYYVGYFAIEATRVYHVIIKIDWNEYYRFAARNFDECMKIYVALPIDSLKFFVKSYIRICIRYSAQAQGINHLHIFNSCIYCWLWECGMCTSSECLSSNRSHAPSQQVQNEH